MKRFHVILFTLLLFFISGCQAVQIEETSVPAGIGIDMEKNKVKVTVQVAKPIAAEQGLPEEDKSQFEVISAQGDTTSEAANKLLLVLPKIPLWTHASVIIIGEEAARNDARFFADLLTRTPDIRKNAILVITKDSSPEEILQVQTPFEPYSANAIRQVLTIQQKQLGYYVPVKLGDFIADITTPGIDPIIPQITIIEHNKTKLLKVDGAAVFRKSVMVGHFNEEEARGYRWLAPGYQQGGIFNIPSPDNPEKLVTIELLRSQAKITPAIEGKKIRILINIKAEGNFYEQNSPGQVLTLSNIDKMEQTAARVIENNIALAIKRAQELNADIFGWGQMVNNKYPSFWAKIESTWYVYFPEVETDIKVNFKLRRSYLTDQSFVFR